MHAAHVSRPQVVRGEHEVSHDAYIDEVMSRFSKKERDGEQARKGRVMTHGLGIVTQHLSRPLKDLAVAGGGTVGDRNSASLEDILRMSPSAVEQALAEAGVGSEEIDAVVLSNISYWGSPGLISHLLQPCGLNPDVDKIELTGAACAGGATAFARAFDYIAAYPDRRVLVVVPERLSTILHGDDTDPMSVVYGRTFTDSVGASVVSGYRMGDREWSKQLGPGMVITQRHEYQLPNTLKFYFSGLDESGKHFGSDPKAPQVTAEIIPEVLLWMKRKDIPFPEWLALHPGSPRILQVMARAFGIDPDVDGPLRHSFKSLQKANHGAVAVSDVLAHLHDDPPPHWSPGLLAAVGPGVNFVTCTGFFSRG
ncbi:hypothetical protein ACFY0Z_30945 [Streptomyces kronopolitis]|uniref:hypothetical protein n=1 Tax=Streptomyces kronopolitis TaxID=1612435 RepID=UPI0036AF721B